MGKVEEEEEIEEQLEDWGDWNAEEEEDSESDLLCLFCDSRFSSSEVLFEHCGSNHHFDFHRIRKTLGLDYYGSFKLINYVRSQVATNSCWICGSTLLTSEDLQKHLHEAVSLDDCCILWDDDKYLKPFIQEDSLLLCFEGDEDIEDENIKQIYAEELATELGNDLKLENIFLDEDGALDMVPSKTNSISGNGSKEEVCVLTSSLCGEDTPENAMVNGLMAKEDSGSSDLKEKGRNLKVSFANVIAKEIKNVNDNYFGAYGSFSIHREMISDKVRMDAYRAAILNNPSLLKGATVLDVGCGTGILSLFAAQAGASRIIAVEGSEKMAAVATQIAKDNGLLWDGILNGAGNQCSGVINVVQGMVEELDRSLQIEPQSVDVLLSEWMGYCLLYESMLSSVLYARDRWLKPGGAMLPDTATIFVAGFGKGGTSIPFWENVYGFNMSCIGRELVEDAASVPIVDVLDGQDLMTNTVVIKTFDLVTMKPEEMDFTVSFELRPKLDDSVDSGDLRSKTTWCYGVLLWFETAFTSRFCREMPTVLSTSPYTAKTHWSQTIFTFREPIAMALKKPYADGLSAIGTAACPASRIHSRISIARAILHRSIDISLETTGIGLDGRKRNWPAQMFNL